MGKWFRRIAIGLTVALGSLLLLAIAGLLYTNIPSNAAGMAAKGVCSATFVAGRDDGQDVFAEDILPASPAFSVISTAVDSEQRSVTAKFLGMFERRAALLPDRGCVLDAEPDPAAVAYAPHPDTQSWPAGDAAEPERQWPKGINAGELRAVIDSALAGAGDPNAANPRGIAVVQNGKLLISEEPDGFPAGTGLHGWSMAKTVAAMLLYKKADEADLDLETPVVDAFPADREPSWVADWREDDRSRITVADLVFMRSGLEIGESYQPWGSVVQMLNGESDMSAWAADHPLTHEPGSFWEYTSGGSNILSAVARGLFKSDAEYWSYPRAGLFDPIGADSAVLETDTSGNWVGSSYVWADVADWARLGQLMMSDGSWSGDQVLPKGWLDLASTPAVADGEGHGYGAQSWLPGDSEAGECRDLPGVPADTVSMEGHWGQVVAMVPSRDAVIVRLGWTIDRDQFDSCKFISDVLATLPG